MTRITLLTALTFLPAPASANYDDVDLQIEAAKGDRVAQTQTLAAPLQLAVEDGTCQLTQEHLVSVPASFADETVTMACLKD